MDTIFPPDGYHAVYQRTKRVYDLYAGGDSDRIREVDDQVGHSDPPRFLREARQWMQRWLKGDPAPLPEETTTSVKEKPEDLACLLQLPADAINYRIADQFAAPVSLKEPASRVAWARRRAELLAQLKVRVFRWFPTERIPFETRALRGGGGYMPKYVDYREVSFQSEDGVRIRAQLLAPKRRVSEAPLLIYVKRPGDSIYAMDMDELLPLLGRYTVLILNPRFTEQSLSAAEYTDVERTAAWVGRTIGALQVWDVLRAVHWAADEEKLSASSISVYGKGEMGVLALYAGLFDERIKQVILNDPPASHRQGPALLNVLRVTDIPEVAGAFAPRRLVSLMKLPEPFHQPQRIYRREGASARFVQAGSLPEALEVWNQRSDQPTLDPARKP